MHRTIFRKNQLQVKENLHANIISKAAVKRGRLVISLMKKVGNNKIIIIDLNRINLKMTLTKEVRFKGRICYK